MVKHAGVAPREKLSGTFTGRTKLTGQGRPRLRVAAWRTGWGALQTNTVYAARYRHLTTRETNRLTPTQAQTVIAAAICGTCTPWSPPAPPGTRRSPPTAHDTPRPPSSPPEPSSRRIKRTVGASPTRH
jgi:hypothetical protein